MKTFIRARYPGKVPETAPVLMRAMFKQPAGVEQTRELEKALLRYPASVYYYGPLKKNQVPFIVTQLREQLRGQWMIFTYQVIPIAPEIAGHHWPHKDFQRWQTYEASPPRVYRLTRGASDYNYKWT